MTIKMYDLAGAQENRRFSPYCWRIRMALAHKGLAVKTIPWRFTEKDAIAFSGQDKVPVIVDSDKIVSDSWDIVNYLEETYPDHPSLFGCPQAQAQTVFVKHWDEQVFQPVLFPMLILDIFNHLHEKDKAYFRETREARFGKHLEEFADEHDEKLRKLRATLAPVRETLRVQSFLAGEQPNFADYILFARFQLARSISPLELLEAGDPVYNWREKMLDLYDGLARKTLGYDV